ncbi:MAG: DEAD/DEAH box helicase, partial [Clostridiales bacterium]|nr:DEAD/DEAH box helicase [Clostridiales bacterium]
MTKKNQIEKIEQNNKQIIAFLKPDGYFETDWQEIKGQISQKELLIKEDLYKRFQMNPCRELLILGLTEKRMSISEPLGYLKDIAIQFVRKLSKRPDVELIRDRVLVQLTDEEIKILLGKAPYLIGEEYLNNLWIRALWKNINRTYNEMIRLYIGSVKDFFDKYNPNIHLVGRIFFHLVENENKGNPFAFLATYSAYINEEGNVKYLPLKNALIEYEGDYLRLNELLSSINKTSEKSDFISKLVDSGDIFESITLNANEAYTFLKEIPIYEEFGISCRIPKWWKNKSESLKMSITVGNNLIRRVDFDSIVDFNADLFLGGEKIEAFELKKLLSETEGLAFIKGKWVEVDYKKLNETLKAYEKAQKILNNSQLSIIEAMRFQINIEKTLNVPKDIFEIEVTNGEWIDSVVTKLIKPEEIQSIDCGSGFTGTLRDYQEKGLNWLYFMKNLGLGACLADDMGLGKTVQALAVILEHAQNGPTLVVAPSSVCMNWISESAKFAPSLNPLFFGDGNRKKTLKKLKAFDILITSYGLLLSEEEILSELHWSTIVLDEAQFIKNYKAKRTKAAFSLKGDYKIITTGTPVENHLSELWTLFCFINPGLLGTQSEFSAKFAIPIEKEGDKNVRTSLKKVIQPFLLRRNKTDVLDELPPKTEINLSIEFSEQERAFYEALRRKSVAAINDIKEGAKGAVHLQVLAELTKLRQACCNPSLISANCGIESSKLKMFENILNELSENKHKALVFSQFVGHLKILQSFCDENNIKYQYLDGSTPLKKRQQYVDAFQAGEGDLFLISLKAGGTGLNLTAADYVIHMDPWW